MLVKQKFEELTEESIVLISTGFSDMFGIVQRKEKHDTFRVYMPGYGIYELDMRHYLGTIIINPDFKEWWDKKKSKYRLRKSVSF